jgi:AcrR family transcriptional regulator
MAAPRSRQDKASTIGSDPEVEGRAPTGRDEVMRALLDAATELLSHRGPSAVSVAEIAKRAGVSRTLVHRHFGSKGALIRAVLKRGEVEMEGLFSEPINFEELVVKGFRHLLTRSLLIDVIAQALIDGVPGEEVQEESKLLQLLGRELERRRAASNKGGLASDSRVIIAAITALSLGWIVFEDWLVQVNALGDRDLGDIRKEGEAILERFTRREIEGAGEAD